MLDFSLGSSKDFEKDVLMVVWMVRMMDDWWVGVAVVEKGVRQELEMVEYLVSW